MRLPTVAFSLLFFSAVFAPELAAQQPDSAMLIPNAETFVGGPPNVILKRPEIQSRLAKLLGKDYARLEKFMAAYGEITLEITRHGRYMVLEGCRSEENCATDNAIVVIDLGRGSIHVAFYSGSRVERFPKTDVEQTPTSVMRWAMFVVKGL